jgi:hypothetical protein
MVVARFCFVLWKTQLPQYFNKITLPNSTKFWGVEG